MAIIKTVIGAVAGLAVLGTAGFFALGQYSKQGEAPGLIDDTLTPCPDSPNCVSSEAGTTGEKLVEPLPLESWDMLPDVIREMSGSITTKTDSYLAAEFTSATMGFVDDLELRLTDNAVQIRSASRVGYSDGGVNSKRVELLRENVALFLMPPDHMSEGAAR